jgi:hypothetical protein
VLAEQMSAGSLHGRGIQRDALPGSTPAQQRRALASILYDVAVMTAERRVAGVKVLRHRMCPANADVSR